MKPSQSRTGLDFKVHRLDFHHTPAESLSANGFLISLAFYRHPPPGMEENVPVIFLDLNGALLSHTLVYSLLFGMC